MLCGSLRNRIRTWLRDYVRLQSLVVILTYAQVIRNFFPLMFSLFLVDNAYLFGPRVPRFHIRYEVSLRLGNAGNPA